MFDWFKRKNPVTVATPPTMAKEDRAVINAFAAGDYSQRDHAIEIHRRYIPILGVRGTVEQAFMAEVDHPSPDSLMRAKYRADLGRM